MKKSNTLRHAIRSFGANVGLVLGAGLALSLPTHAHAQSTLNLNSIPAGQTAAMVVMLETQEFSVAGEQVTEYPNDALNATIDNTGKYSIPVSEVNLEAIDTGLGYTVTPVLTGAVSGVINPSTGEWTMKLNLQFNVDETGEAPSGCFVGPVTWNMTSLNDGGAVKYSTSTGDAVLRDDTFTIPAVTDANHCSTAMTKLINSGLDLPTAVGESWVNFGVSVSPIVIGSVCVTNATEVESTGTQYLGCVPSSISGKVASSSDHDSYAFSGVASGKHVYVEHVATYTYKFQEDCVNGQDIITKSYSGPLLKLNGSTAYTKSVQSTTGGKSCDMGGGGTTYTTVTTYKLKREVSLSNGMYTIGTDPNSTTDATFPVTGNYKLTVSVQ